MLYLLLVWISHLLMLHNMTVVLRFGQVAPATNFTPVAWVSVMYVHLVPVEVGLGIEVLPTVAAHWS